MFWGPLAALMDPARNKNEKADHTELFGYGRPCFKVGVQGFES